MSPHSSASKAKEFIITNIKILERYDAELSTGNLWIRDGEIVETPDSQAVQKLTPNIEQIDGTGLIATPPLWNAHTHCALNFFRGLGQQETPPNGLSMIETVLFPAEKNLTQELVAPLAYAHLVESLRSGAVGVFDHYYFVDGIGDAVERLGMRAFLGETVGDLGGAHPGLSAWHRARKSIENWRFSSRVRPMVAPHAADTVSRPLLTELAAYAQKNQLPLHMHLSQTTGERQRVTAREKLSPVKYAEQCGALFNQSLLVHLITADADDLKILRKHGSTAGYCPTSQIIYEKLAPIAEFIQNELPIVLGTDCAASNDSGNMLAEQKIAALTCKLRNRSLPASAILKWTMWNPLALTGMQNNFGQLTGGKAADIIFFADEMQFFPNHDFANNLVFSAESRNVRHVLVDGEWILWNGETTRVNLNDLKAEYRAACNEILRRIKAA